LELALKSGGDVNYVNSRNGETPFSVFCSRKGVFGEGRFVTEGLMIESGAAINHRGKDGNTVTVNSFNVFDWGRVEFLLGKGASASCYNEKDWLLIHHVAFFLVSREPLFTSDPTRLAEWNASSEKKEFDRIVALLEERGFSLEEAKTDVRRRNEMVDGVPYMKWRRMQREDKDACSEEPAKSAAAAGQPEKKVDE
jgi:hypothetical protein